MTLKRWLLIVLFCTGVTVAAPEQAEHFETTELPVVPGDHSLFVELLWVKGENQMQIIIPKQVFTEVTGLNYVS